jgi:hypothetical protein
MFARHFLDRRLDRLGHPPIELVARVPDLNQSHAAVGRSRDVKRQAVGPILWPIDSLRDGVVVLGLEPVEFHDDSDGHPSPFCFGNAASVLIRDNAARFTTTPGRVRTDQLGGQRHRRWDRLRQRVSAPCFRASNTNSEANPDCRFRVKQH